MATSPLQVRMKPSPHTYRSSVQTLDSIWHVLLGVVFVALLLACASDARAGQGQEEVGARTSELWLDSGFWSHHTQQRAGKPYRENNDGIGIEWRYKPQWQINVGHYRNSVGGSSNYLQWGWTPLAWQPVRGVQVQAGGSIGVVNGYRRIHGGKYFPTLVPVLTTQWQRVGVNLVYIPSVGRIDGAYAAQLKLRIY